MSLRLLVIVPIVGIAGVSTKQFSLLSTLQVLIISPHSANILHLRFLKQTLITLDPRNTIAYARKIGLDGA